MRTIAYAKARSSGTYMGMKGVFIDSDIPFAPKSRSGAAADTNYALNIMEESSGTAACTVSVVNSMTIKQLRGMILRKLENKAITMKNLRLKTKKGNELQNKDKDGNKHTMLYPYKPEDGDTIYYSAVGAGGGPTDARKKILKKQQQPNTAKEIRDGTKVLNEMKWDKDITDTKKKKGILDHPNMIEEKL